MITGQRRRQYSGTALWMSRLLHREPTAGAEHVRESTVTYGITHFVLITDFLANSDCNFS